MFNSVTESTSSCKTALVKVNEKIDEGEQAITDTNNNYRTDKIVNSIETAQGNINKVIDSITSINESITALEADIETSKSLRIQELSFADAEEEEMN